MTTSDTAVTAQNLEAALAGLREEMIDVARDVEDAKRRMRSFSSTISRSFTSAVDDLVIKGESASEALRGLGHSISRSLLRAAIAPIGDALGSAVTSAVGNVVGGGVTALFGGGAAAGASPRAFATGGAIVGGRGAGPSLFPLGSGFGVAGEAGAEAILPLRRGADGRLGVAATGPSAAPRISVTISTPDAASFRRSRAQVASQLTRALDRGRRNL